MMSYTKKGKPIYALYKGETWLTDGTTREIASWLGRAPHTVRNMSTQPLKNGLMLCYIGRETEIELKSME